jgi:hypothetical protein
VDVNIILCIQPLELCLVQDSRRRDKGFNGPIDLYSAAFLFISPAFGFSFLRCSIFRVYQVTIKSGSPRSFSREDVVFKVDRGALVLRLYFLN